MLLPLPASPQLESGVRQTGSPSCSDIKYKPQECRTWHCVSFSVVPNEKRNVFVCLGSGLKTFHFWWHRDDNTQQKERFPSSKHPLPPLLLKKWSPYPLEPSPSCSAVIEPSREVFFSYNFSLPNSLAPCAEGWVPPDSRELKIRFLGTREVKECWPGERNGFGVFQQPALSIPGHSVLLHSALCDGDFLLTSLL